MILTKEDLQYYDLEAVKKRLYKNEPAFALRACDVTAPILIKNYADMLISLPDNCTNEQIFAKGVAALEVYKEFIEFQQDHFYLVKLPDMPNRK